MFRSKKVCTNEYFEPIDKKQSQFFLNYTCQGLILARIYMSSDQMLMEIPSGARFRFRLI